jgi:uncharacterized protein YjbJ (UPF0337 family)
MAVDAVKRRANVPAALASGERTMGELKDKAKGLANEVAGNVKQQSGDPDTRAEGQAQETKGEAQNLKGKVEGAFGNKV